MTMSAEQILLLLNNAMLASMASKVLRLPTAQQRLELLGAWERTELTLSYAEYAKLLTLQERTVFDSVPLLSQSAADARYWLPYLLAKYVDPLLKQELYDITN